jgi:hypothetical protein
MQDITMADAIRDRLVHNAYKTNLKGKSFRNLLRNLQKVATTGYNICFVKAMIDINAFNS